jgi:2-oxoglutarate dehydrogenase complex dehydrogenase (E1) component-like enzyme
VLFVCFSLSQNKQTNTNKSNTNTSTSTSKQITMIKQDGEHRTWLAEQLEKTATLPLSKEEKIRVMKLILEAEVFDLFLQRKFPFVKR